MVAATPMEGGMLRLYATAFAPIIGGLLLAVGAISAVHRRCRDGRHDARKLLRLVLLDPCHDRACGAARIRPCPCRPGRQACAGGRVSAESGCGLKAATATECSAPGLRGGAAAPLVGAQESGRRRFEFRYGQP